MAYEEINDLGAEKSFALGGIRKDKKTGKKFKNPKEVEGYYMGAKTVQLPGQDKPSKLHVFQGEVKNDKGETIFTGTAGIWGKTDLDRKLGSAKIGVMTKAYFDKMQDPAQVKPGRQPMYLYKSFQDPQNTTGVEDIVGGEEVFEEEAAETVDTTSGEEVFEEEAGLEDEEPALDEVQAAPAKKPAAVKTPPADRQAQMQRLMGTKPAKTA